MVIEPSASAALNVVAPESTFVHASSEVVIVASALSPEYGTAT
jgi:hypothetical protein